VRLLYFPDKVSAATEFTRVLRPGGRLGLTDVTIADTGLPDELTTVSAWVGCIADARPLTRYIDVLTDAGLHITHTETHDEALARMIEQIEARLHLGYIDVARRALGDGLVGYALIVAEKP
jgi:arsenite methyltransferase